MAYTYRWIRDGVYQEAHFPTLELALARVAEHALGPGVDRVRPMEITNGATTVKSFEELSEFAEQFRNTR